jgi:hypothetical protein
MTPFRSRGELVISMTLAETFLLLVFMIWYSNQPKNDPLPPTTREALKAENQRLTKENERLQSELDDLNRRLAFWRKYTGLPVPGSEEEFKKFLFEAGRGKPKCQEENVIADVSVINGTTALKALADSPGLRTTLQAQGVDFSPGVTIKDPVMIQKVLRAARDFRKPPDNTECRFDYTLKYQTHDDFYEGVERFEKYFYTVGRTQTKAP